MYLGWMKFAGNEISNAARTAAYVRNLMPTFGFKDVYEAPFLSYALDESTTYVDPVTDEAPWYDPGAPESGDFMGFYLLSQTGITDSTASVEIVEGAGNGGTPSLERLAAREIRLRGLLIGKTPEGAEAGMTWLRSIMLGAMCGGNCDGDDLCFLIAPPSKPLDGARVVRKIREVTRLQGPTVRREYNLKCGGYLIEVEILLMAGSPWIYGEPTLVASAVGAGLTSHVTGATIEILSTNLGTCVTPPALLPTWSGYTVDPDCPPIPAAPTMPAPTEVCADMPTNWKTYSVYVPDDLVDTWKDGVVQLQVINESLALRFMRIRLLPRVLPTMDVEDIDPCGACGDMMVSYVPPGATLTLDGMTERASISVGNRQPISASHLIKGTAGEVPEWPVFTCGMGYYMLVEIPSDRSLKALTLNVVNRE